MICLVATVALVLALYFPALGESFQGRVVSITDGDTIRVLRDGEQVRVRLHGIDARSESRLSGLARGNMPESWLQEIVAAMRPAYDDQTPVLLTLSWA